MQCIHYTNYESRVKTRDSTVKRTAKEGLYFRESQGNSAQKNKVVRRMRNLWLVTSSNPKTPKRVYEVCFDYALDCFTCTCPHYEHRAGEICKHIIASAIYEGSHK